MIVFPVAARRVFDGICKRHAKAKAARNHLFGIGPATALT
jgi:hypothetical protein